MKKQIRCIVAAIDANGEPSLFFVIINGTTSQFARGQHYHEAIEYANKCGYEGKLAFDEYDTDGKAMLGLFIWQSATVIDI
jgi:hypothetical protein